MLLPSLARFRYSTETISNDFQEGLESNLTSLVEFEMIFEKSTLPELEYLFKHSSLGSCIQLASEKAEGKLSIEKLPKQSKFYCEKLDEYYEMLAFHYLNEKTSEGSLLP